MTDSRRRAGPRTSWLWIVAAASLAFGASLGSDPAHAARATHIWALASSAYPSHSQIEVDLPTNFNAETLYGPYHVNTFSQLQRIEGSGWEQEGGVVRRTPKKIHGHVTSVRHFIFWGYLVSYYPSGNAALAAMDDSPLPFHPFTVRGDSGRTLALSNGSAHFILSYFMRGNIEIESLCSLDRSIATKYKGILTKYCGIQQNKLAVILNRQSVTSRPDTPTPSPSPTSTPTPSPLPTAIPSATSPAASPTASDTPTVEPTDTPTVPIPAPTGTPTTVIPPTATATATPEDVEVSASVNNPAPAQNSTETLTGKITVNGQGVPGAEMATTWFFKLGTVECTSASDSTGTARCSEVVNAEPGDTVQVHVDFSYNGQDYQTDAFFTVS